MHYQLHQLIKEEKSGLEHVRYDNTQIKKNCSYFNGFFFKKKTKIVKSLYQTIQ